MKKDLLIKALPLSFFFFAFFCLLADNLTCSVQSQYSPGKTVANCLHLCLCVSHTHGQTHTHGTVFFVLYQKKKKVKKSKYRCLST